MNARVSKLETQIMLLQLVLREVIDQTEVVEDEGDEPGGGDSDRAGID